MTVRSTIALLYMTLAALVAGCTSEAGQDQEKDVSPPDPEMIRQVEAASSADDLSFQTAETVDALSFGLVGDGRTDNTAVFTRLLAGGDRTIHVPAGDYVTSSLQFDPN